MKKILNYIKIKAVQFWKSFKFKIQLYDGLWSVPVAFTLFWFCGILLQMINYRTPTYDSSFIQPLFLSAALTIGFTNFTILGLYFTFRGIFRYLYGYRSKTTGEIKNYSKIDWKNITAWQRFKITFLLFFSYLAVQILVYKMFY